MKPSLRLAFASLTLLVSLLCQTRADAGWPPLFRGAQLYDSGTWSTSAVTRETDPAGVAAADLNGDGWTDLLTVDVISSTVTVLLHSGDSDVSPLFRPKVTYPCPGGPHTIALADMNQDGRQDVVAYTHANTVSVLLSTGPGLFGPAVSYAVPASFEPGHRICAKDVNGDNWPDVILPFNSFATQGIAVLLGTGSGNLGACTTYDFGTVNESFVAVVGADVTGDGVVDLVLARGGIGPMILAGNNNGTFSVHSNPVVAEDYVSDVAVADLNSDNKLDIVVGGTHSSPPSNRGVSVLIATGSGNFQPSVQYALPLEPASLALGDVTGDQIPDIVVGFNKTGDTRIPLAIVPGTGNGAFLAPTYHSMSVYFGDLALADLNGNGRLDIVAPNGPSLALLHTITVLLDDGAGGFLSTIWSLIDRRSFRQAIGDFNRDGKPDAAYCDSISVRVGVGNGSGSFVDIGGPTTSTKPEMVLAADLNRDAKLDMVIQNGPDVRRCMGAGDGTFTSPIQVGTGALYPRSMVDIDQDGRTDMVVRFSLNASTIRILLQQANGTFAPNGSHSTSGAIHAIAHGDWNRDGTAEVAYASSNGVAIVPWTGTGLGTAVSVSTGRAYMDVCAGDFNRDGKLDVAALDSLAGQSGTRGIDVFLGDGAGGFGPAISEPTLEQNGVRLEAWDANMDGILDLVASGLSDFDFDLSARSASVEIHQGAGSGTFGLRTAYSLGGITTGQDAPYFTAGDVNGDDLPDVLASSVVFHPTLDGRRGMQTLVAIPPDQGFGLGPKTDYAMSTATSRVVMGDINRDGILDAVSSSREDLVSVRLGTAQGALGPSSTLPQSHPCRQHGLGDFNRDGILDLVTSRTSLGFPETMSIMLGLGNGTFGPRTDFMNPGCSDFAVADMNRDGKLDLVMGQADLGYVNVALGNGDGTFTTMPQATVPWVYDLEVADVDRDGILDVTVVGGGLYILYGNGDGTLDNSITIPFGGNFHLAHCTGDFDRDGYVDIATITANDSKVYVMWGSSTYTTGSGIQLPSTGWDIQAGPAEADGRTFLYISAFGNQVHLLAPGGSPGPFTLVGSYPVGVDPETIALVDLNRDGILDVVTANYGSSNLSVLLHERNVVTGVAVAPSATPRAWLGQNAPNPFNPITTVRFAVSAPERVSLAVYDVHGRLVTMLVEGLVPAGDHTARWDGRSDAGTPAASGVYFYRLETASGYRESKRMVMLK